MKITSFSLCGFRNIGQTVINLKSITALVSLNSYGKSNLFSALDFALTFMRASSELRRNMMGNVSFMPLNVNIDDSDFIFSIEGDYEEKENTYTVHYGFSFEWAKDCDKGARITSEELYIRDKKAKSHKKPLLQRDANGIRIRSSMTGRCSTKIGKDLSDTELALDFLKVSSPDYMEGIVQSIAGIRAYIDEQLDASSLYHQIPQIVFHNNDGNQPLFENIPRSLFLLKQKEPVLYNSLIDIFTSLFPNITGVEILESDISKDLKTLVEKDAPFTVSPKIYSLWVKDRNMNQPLDFRFLSAGAKRILMQLVHIANARISGISIVGLEEPENSIHPALFQGFLDTLEGLADDMRIIITSHSPHLLQYLDFSGIYIGLPSDDGIARFRTFASSRKIQELMTDAEESYTLVGNYIFELLSGNESERKILASYLEDADES